MPAESVPNLIVNETDLLIEHSPRYDEALQCFMGEPWSNDGVYYVPDLPYIHSAFVESSDDHGGYIRSPKPQTIMVAHGFRDGKGEWTLKDGRSVSGFINIYNVHNPKAPIEVVAVCNPTDQGHSDVQHMRNTLVGVSGYRDNDVTVVSMRPIGA